LERRKKETEESKIWDVLEGNPFVREEEEGKESSIEWTQFFLISIIVEIP